jgi:hypothetical protein
MEGKLVGGWIVHRKKNPKTVQTMQKARNNQNKSHNCYISYR